MGLYIAIMLFILLFGYGSKLFLHREPGKLYLFCVFATLWTLLAFKGATIGSDTPDYIQLYKSAVDWVKNTEYTVSYWVDLFQNNSRFETGYVVLNRLFAMFTDNPQWMFAILATFFIIPCKNLILKHSKNIVLSLFLFVSLRHYYLYFSGLRQVIAMTLTIISMRFVEKRKLLPFALIILLATYFHRSSAIFFVIYPLSFLRFNIKGILLVSVTSVVCVMLFNPLLSRVLNFLPEYYSGYTNSTRFESGQLGNILVAAMQLIFLSLHSVSNYNEDDQKQILLRNDYSEKDMMPYMTLFSFWLAILSIRAATLNRLFWYTWIFGIVHIPNLIHEIKDRNLRIVITILTIILTFIYNIVLLYYRPEWNRIIPYQFFWSN